MRHDGKTILLVEDESVIALARSRRLAAKGYAVRVAHSGEQALAQLGQCPDVDLVLMDIDLGAGIDGTETAERILARWDLPIIFLFSETDPAMVERTEGISSYGYVDKNSDETVLFASIGMALRLSAARAAERRQREALERKEKLLEATLASIGDGVITTDTDGRVVDMNTVAASLTGWPVDEALGRPSGEIFRIVDAATRTPGIDPIPRVLAEGIVVGLSNHTILIARDGSERQIADSCAPITNRSGTILGAVLVFRDVTAQYEQDAKLAELSEELGERVKELEAVYRISKALDHPDTGYSQTIETVLRHLVGGMRFPDHACARMKIGGKEVETDGFRASTVRLAADLRVSGATAGVIEIFYREEEPSIHAPAFLEGEERMITIVAEQLSVFLDQRRAESILRSSEARYRAIFEQSPDGICIADTTTGRIIDCNDALAALVGKRPADLIGLPQSVLHPAVATDGGKRRDPAEPRTEEFLEHLKGADGRVLETQVLSEEGRLRDVEITAHHVDYLGSQVLQGVFRDITEVKAIRDRASFQSRLLDNVGQAVVVTDAAGTITYWNAAAERLFGWSSGEALERPVTEVTPAEDAAALAAEVMERLTAGKTWKGRITMRRKDGSTFPAIVSDTPVFSSEGDLVAIIGVTTDVTELTEAEANARKLLAEKELILREVNHRIKNNIYTMISMLSLQASAASSEELRRGLEGAMQRMTSMLVLYENLYRSDHVSEFPVDGYMRDLVARIAESTGLSGSTSITMDLPATEWNARALSVLGIIVNELLTNAAKYAFVGRDTGRISLTITSEGSRSRLVYTDDGVGIPGDINPAESEGLGLRFIAALAEQLDGGVTVDGSRGTRITVEFETPPAG